MVKISVIVPVFNMESYLTRCLKSIEAQTFSDFEVQIVDDGSTDRSREIAKAFAQRDARFRVWFQKNAGQGAARNTGICRARGEFLLFVDADDEIDPCMLETLYQAACTDSRIQLVFCNTREMNSQGKRIGCFSENLCPNRLIGPEQTKMLLLLAPGPGSKLYRTKLFHDTGVRFPARVWYEDLRTTVKLAAHIQYAYYVPEELYFYYYRHGSSMHNAQIERNREIIAAFEDLCSYFQDNHLFSLYQKELEYLTIFHLYLTASVRVLRNAPHSGLLKEFSTYLQGRFPQYRTNCYLTRFNRTQWLVFRLLEKKQVRLLSFLFRIMNRWKGSGQ